MAKGTVLKKKIMVFSRCLVVSFLFCVLCFCSWKENCFIVGLFWNKTAKTWWTGAAGKPCGLLFILCGLNLKAGLASLGSRWRNQAPLNLSCGPVYGVVLRYPRWCMACWLAVAVEGLDLMTTCSVCCEEYDDNPSCPVCACFLREHGQPVPRVLPCSWWSHASMQRGFSWP